MMAGGNYWTTPAVRTLREMAAEGASTRMIAESMGRTRKSVKNMASRLGVKLESNRSRESTPAQRRWRAMRAGGWARLRGQAIDSCPANLDWQCRCSWKAGWHDQDMAMGNSVIAGRL